VPVLGSALIIAAGSEAWVNRIIFSNKILVWFGLISYPLYLWHWPILSFSRIIVSETLGSNIRIVAVLFAIALSWFTYKFVECPIRFGKHGKVKVAILVVLMAVACFVGYNIFQRGGLPFRNVVKINASLSSRFDGGAGVSLAKDCGIDFKYKDIQNKIGICVSDIRMPLRYALIGDSKASAIFEGLIRTSSDDGRWLFIGGNSPYGSLIPVISDADIYKNFQPLSRVAINSVASNTKIEKVVLVTAARALFQLSNDVDIEDLPTSKNYEAALDGLKGAVQILVSSGKKVILVVDNPTLPHPEDCINRKTNFFFVNKILVHGNPKCVLSLDTHLMLSTKYRELLQAVKTTYPSDIEIFDTTKYLCDESRRECTHIKDGRLLYGYTDHLSDYASGILGVNLNAFLNTYVAR
jgi:hypothetical protein